MYKNVFVIFIFLFFVVFNGYTQRNGTSDENINAYDVSDKSFRNIYVTIPRIHSTEIGRLQERLMELGFTGIAEIDSYYGPLTAGEIYFIKAALGFIDCYIPENDWQPEDYSVVNEELWDSIFDPKNTIILSGISQIRLFNNDLLVHEPENNPNVAEFKETQLPFIEPDWVPPWGSGNSSKVQREYYYSIGTNRISIIETTEIVFVTRTTVRNFTFQNGMQIRQSIYTSDSPITEVRFSIP